MSAGTHGKILRNSAEKLISDRGGTFMKGSDPLSRGLLNADKLNTKALDIGSIGQNMFETPNLKDIGDFKAEAAKLAGMAVGMVTAEAGAILGEFVGKYMNTVTSIPATVMQKAIKRFNDPKKDPHKLNLKDLIAEYCFDHNVEKEAYDKEIQEKTNNNKIKQKLDELNEHKKEVKNFINDAEEKINKVIAYAAEGTDYVAETMGKQVDAAVENITNKLNTTYDNFKKDVDEYCEDKGNIVGENMIIQYNKNIKKLAKKQIDDIENKKRSILNKSHEQKQKSILKIMGKLGINIPIK